MKKQIMSVLTLLVMFSSCKDNTKEKFERVKQLNTVSVYETFIKENYESQYADSALVRLQGLEFRQAITIQDLENFKRKYAQSIFSDSASAKIHALTFQDLAVKKPFTKNRLKELKAYLANHPKGMYAERIQKTLDSLKKATPKPTPPPPAPKKITVVDDSEETVVETTEFVRRKVKLDKKLVPKDQLANWVKNYGLQNLIDKAEDDNVYAQRRLGRYYRYVAKDDEEAVYWYEIAAEQLDFIALGNLAYHLENGIGVEKSKEAAAKSLAFGEAVRSPGVRSKFSGIRGILGLENARNLVMDVLVESLLRNGTLFKITKDEEIIGNVYYNTAEVYRTGLATKYPKDISKAIAFYKLSVKYGNRAAKERLSELN